MTDHTPSAAVIADTCDLAIVSLHEKGFWQVDLYTEASHLSGDEMEQMGLLPTAFKTFKKGGDAQEAVNFAKKHWPQAVIEFAVEENVEDDE